MALKSTLYKAELSVADPDRSFNANFLLALALPALLAACSLPGLTDPATRLAADLEAGAKLVAAQDGSRHAVVHRTPSKAGECDGPYSAQLDEVGALVIWCKDPGSGSTKSSHSTSSHAKSMSTKETFIINKTSGEDLVVELARIGGKVVIVAVR